MKYRILAEDGIFYPQYRKWFKWFNFEYIVLDEIVRFGDRERARQFILGVIADKKEQKIANAKRLPVVVEELKD